MPEPTLALRAARRGDIPRIVATADSSVDDADLVGFSTAQETNPFVDVAKLSAAWKEPNRVGTEEVLVAELDGRVVAYTTVEDRGDVLELVNIDVDRACQRRGIGTRLVRFVEGRARAEGKVAVTLGTSRNAVGVPWKSLPWWQKLGYRVTHEEENAWTRRIGPGAREIRMRKEMRAPPAEGVQ